ncbi:MAG: anaerobic ribonucleoside-triphosphate reductase activating protein [Methanomicrobiales archaeon]|nr:anaerobic ribonucleoside-triphosphate reductase activating protein [Methanomicrobiales archaeon]
MDVNFGGFVPISTVDWRGKAVCTVFLRGCPVRCTYCHNASILSGNDTRPVEEVIGMIRSSRLLISGVVFSGGEPTMQEEPLVALAGAVKKMGLLVGVQTNGVYPDTLEVLIEQDLVDRIALDIKARWQRYDNLMNVPCVSKVQRSLSICRAASKGGKISEFEVVITLFRGYEDEVPYISRECSDVDLVIQQGVQGDIPPMSCSELTKIADQLNRPVRIRTREGGEISYEGSRDRWITRER